MRVALIATASFDYCVEYAEMLTESCEVLLCAPEKSVAGRSFVDPRVEIAPFHWPRHRSPGNIILIYKLLARIRAWRPDIVHFLGENNIWLNLLPPLLRGVLGVPVATTVHDIDYHPGDSESRRVPRLFIDRFIRQADAVIVHGETLRAAALDKLPVRRDRLFVFPHPPLNYYARLAAQRKMTKTKDGSFRILFFGRIYEYKGLKYLLEAAQLALPRLPSLRIVVAGRGDDLTNESLRIPETENFDLRNRFIPDEELAQLLTDADVVALPYIEASQSGVLMAALAFGLPVIATDVGEIAELVRTTGAGLIVPPRDGAALADAILELGANEPLRLALAAKAAKALQETYSSATLAAKAMDIYQAILAAHAAPSAQRPA
ncbi:glycosyltransferase family 4 protein [Methylocapsa acidiphila]|uniref:glycosyltransferase family 4 protein n=1 Tax=Methylocapsa acidiphila TaxID=133552 RepID=UPI0012EC6E36|nr:glycosyltransferase family 4 protein [Methylocapsa acidiphila]